MADNFSKFKKKYEKGEIKTMAMPPIVPGPGGLARSAAGVVARPLVRYLTETTKAAAKNAKNAGRNKSLDKAGKAASKQKNPFRRGDTGTLTDKLAKTRTRARTEKESERFGPLVKRKDNLPATRGGRDIVKRKDNLPAVRSGRDVVVREGKGDLKAVGSRAVAVRGGKTFGDKGQGGRIVGLSNRGKLAAGAVVAGGAGAAYMGYKKADNASATPKGDMDRRAPNGRIETYSNKPRDDRAPPTRQGTSPANQSKAQTFKDKRQGMNVKGSPTNPTRKAGDTSRLSKAAPKRAEKPMSNFERQKARQYEKEGWGGRSMTASKAKSRVKAERGFKFKDLFK